MKILVGLLSLIALVSVAGGVILNRQQSLNSLRSAGAGIGTSDRSGASPVLVELFTSEGCSSCPPADKILAALQAEQPIAGAEVIALSEHVDYWNHLGWKDPYSSAEFSRRQSEYAVHFGAPDQVYTPEMVVDGAIGFVGSDVSAASDAISKAAAIAKAKVTVAISDAAAPAASKSIPLDIKVEGLSAVSAKSNAKVILAIAESGLRSSVSKGENAGHELTHVSVVRKFIQLGQLDARSKDSFERNVALDIADSWNRSQLRAVVFVQDQKTGRILGVGETKLGIAD
jgi:hypothetical protein